MILATKPYFPDREAYKAYVDRMWETGWLTNNSINVKTLEERLAEYLDVPNIALLNNGTIAIQIAIKALGLTGDILTTPFSYVATTSSIIWEGCRPVFVDIDPNTYCIDPAKIEAAITPGTQAILATHVYGLPCDVEAIDAIAKKHGLKVVYDAAHAFGVTWKGRSILNYGDVSTLSFHATKLFHTVEGGSVTSTDPEVARIMEYQRRFGHDGPYKFHGAGINAKLSEPHAAFGLCVLDDIEKILAKRKAQWKYYESALQDCSVRMLRIQGDCGYNYAYFPVQFAAEEILLDVLQDLEAEDIYPRRYFMPSLNQLDFVEYMPCPVSESISKRVLCLPLFHTLTEAEQENIVSIVERYTDI